jgi:hypothetical protein
MLRHQCDALLKQGTVIIKLLFVMVDVRPYEIKGLLQIITRSQNYDQIFKVAMTYLLSQPSWG